MIIIIIIMQILTDKCEKNATISSVFLHSSLKFNTVLVICMQDFSMQMMYVYVCDANKYGISQISKVVFFFFLFYSRIPLLHFVIG